MFPHREAAETQLLTASLAQLSVQPLQTRESLYASIVDWGMERLSTLHRVYSSVMHTLQPIAVYGDQLLAEARKLSYQLSGSNEALNKWMECAKKRRMKWVQGLEYAIEKMKAELA